MRVVIVKDVFEVEVDKYKNHQPIIFKKGGDIIKVGFNKGQPAKDRMVRVDKYFRNMAECLRFGIENGHITGESLVTDEDITASEYLERVLNVENSIKSLMELQK
jgi:hypothetical protein